jgi:MFS family permease
MTAWTALIGTVLASLSAGYWLGGRWADRDSSPERLAIIVAVAAVAIACTALMADVVMAFISVAVGDIRLAALLGTLFLFGPTALLLGTVTPWAAKLLIRDLTTDGTAVGTLSALSTCGSIAGTFLAGFVLIGYLGTVETLAVLAVVTATAALLVDASRRTLLLVAVAVGIAVIGWIPTTNESGCSRASCRAAGVQSSAWQPTRSASRRCGIVTVKNPLPGTSVSSDWANSSSRSPVPRSSSAVPATRGPATS